MLKKFVGAKISLKNSTSDFEIKLVILYFDNMEYMNYF